MSFFSILETLLIGPLKLVFEIIFELAHRLIRHPGLAIVALSLVMNLLVLPLYKRADAMQERARDMEAKLRDGIAHIKKTFSGDERMMILQTYYRQNNYSPLSALNGSVSLLLEIPFFMAAYQFLSHLEVLNGVSLGPIADLGAPDGLIVIGSLQINLLPILMTLINVISSALYLKGFPLKTKIQLYGMALFFLVFLYTSPSCLVFYWTLNNVFSLGKTLVYKLIRSPKFIERQEAKQKAKEERNAELVSGKEVKPNKKIFVLGALFLTVLIGLVIPTTYIAASPQEYIDLNYFHNPLWYVVSTASLSAGFFLVWMRVFYWLSGPKGKVVFEKAVWILSGVLLVNYMFFGTNLGVISSTLQYEESLQFTFWEHAVNLLCLAAVAFVMYLAAKHWKRAVATVLLTAVIALSGMSALNVVTIKRSVDEISKEEITGEEATPHFQLSKTGKNVIVFMLDRAMGQYIPYLLNEKPELKEQFAGFTYYSNTISFGGFTNVGTPAMLGGYEYTPVEMNKRDKELLVTKHNEALKVMPVTFLNHGFKVTVCDPVYANYQWIPDLSIYDEYPEIQKYITKGKFGSVEQKKATIQNNHRNFFCFSLMKTMPLFVQPGIYDYGRYLQAVSYTNDVVYSTQNRLNKSVATGLHKDFMEAYNALTNLPQMTKVTEGEENTFLFMANDVTHDPMLLREPSYKPVLYVDNTQYDEKHTDRFTVNGITLKVDDSLQMSHYQSNMAALIQLGKWFDYLRENGVYDNTKIILVSDHGRHLGQLEELIMDDGSDKCKDVELYYPLLMVKDFGSTEFSTSDEFMTNGDVPTLAMKDVIANPVNPFTGKPINSDEKTAHDQFVIMTEKWSVATNDGYTYLPSEWASVKDDLWDKDNWTFYDGNRVLKEHKAP
ncbi:MAG: YidC/Oxa1 family membrane protein insertase [Lachnospiraceae bacterium]|nr:YidC/Oxa1 family membrane protein insertase [Lachnospiraceae bacterium]